MYLRAFLQGMLIGLIVSITKTPAAIISQLKAGQWFWAFAGFVSSVYFIIPMAGIWIWKGWVVAVVSYVVFTIIWVPIVMCKIKVAFTSNAN